MLRRAFLGCCAGLLLVGCLGKHRYAEPDRWGSEPSTPVDPVQTVTGRLQDEMSGSGVSFDPFTLSILATIICNVLKFCIEHNALRLQRAIRRRPDGAQAILLRGKLTSHFQREQSERSIVLFSAESNVGAHVDATMSALMKATPDELSTLMRDLKRTDSEDPKSASVAQEWSRIE